MGQMAMNGFHQGVIEVRPRAMVEGEEERNERVVLRNDDVELYVKDTESDDEDQVIFCLS